MKKGKATAQKNTLLKNAQGNRTSNFFKRVFFFFTPRQNFPTAYFFSPTHGLSGNRTDTASNVNRFEQSVCCLDTTPLRTDRRASGNKGFKKLGVQ